MDQWLLARPEDRPYAIYDRRTFTTGALWTPKPVDDAITDASPELQAMMEGMDLDRPDLTDLIVARYRPEPTTLWDAADIFIPKTAEAPLLKGTDPYAYDFDAIDFKVRLAFGFTCAAASYQPPVFDPRFALAVSWSVGGP